MHSLLRWWHTARHLRPTQIWHQAWRRVPRRAPRGCAAPPRREPQAEWCPSIARLRLAGPGELEIFGSRYRLHGAEDWNHIAWPSLVKYHLHYFDDLAVPAAGDRRDWQVDLMTRWVAENPPGRHPGWDPFPTSLRVVNWIKWAIQGQTLAAELLDSLATQVDHLSRHIEWHLLGNHLLANGKALLFAGLFFDGPQARRWHSQGQRLLLGQFEEQILPDGGHFELSPMYHAVVLEDLLDLYNLMHVFGHHADFPWSETLSRMQGWLNQLCHPDGSFALFNDCAGNGAAAPADLRSYARRLGLSWSSSEASPGVHRQPSSGYARCRFGPWTALLDTAPLGPDYQPGHAHADSLSFELSWHHQRLIVDSGTGQYEAGPERSWQRGTAAHNTVRLDGRDSSEVWSSFRVARRARIVDAGGFANGVYGEHDGYAQLGICGNHRREWHFTPREVRIVDRLEGHDEHLVEWYLHFHPAVCVRQLAAHEFTLFTEREGSVATVFVDARLTAAVHSSDYFPGFGQHASNQTLLASQKLHLPVELTCRIISRDDEPYGRPAP